jgi:hypothetical protein
MSSGKLKKIGRTELWTSKGPKVTGGDLVRMALVFATSGFVLYSLHRILGHPAPAESWIGAFVAVFLGVMIERRRRRRTSDPVE